MYNVIQKIITWGALAGAIGAFATLVWKAFSWINRQKAQDKELEAIREEQTLVIYGLLACLKGLREQGCDGPVNDAINRIEKHINKKAHEGA